MIVATASGTPVMRHQLLRHADVIERRFKPRDIAGLWILLEYAAWID